MVGGWKKSNRLPANNPHDVAGRRGSGCMVMAAFDQWEFLEQPRPRPAWSNEKILTVARGVFCGPFGGCGGETQRRTDCQRSGETGCGCRGEEGGAAAAAAAAGYRRVNTPLVTYGIISRISLVLLANPL